MLFQTFEQIKQEAKEPNISHMLTVDSNKRSAHLQLSIGNILGLSLELSFFAAENDNEDRINQLL